MYDHILIDGKNMLYGAIFAAHSDKKFKSSGHHSINIILHFLKYYMNKFQPNNFHVFWDARRDKVWRRKVAPEYKGNRDTQTQNKDVDITKQLAILTEVCTVLFKNMAIMAGLLYVAGVKTTPK